LIKVLSFLFIMVSAQAEYRVYQYYIKSRHPSSIDQEPYLVTSTLTPQAYLAYHGGAASLQIDLLRTWPCYGHTAFKETCNPPLLLDNQNEDDTPKKEDVES
jgi:hypothetical protein